MPIPFGKIKFMRRATSPAVTTYLSRDETIASPTNVFASSVMTTQNGIVQVKADAFYFPPIPTSAITEADARKKILEYVDSLRLALRARELAIVRLTRGRTVIRDIHLSRGDLVHETESGDVIALANCYPESVAIVEDVGLHGIKMAVTFTAVASVGSPS